MFLASRSPRTSAFFFATLAILLLGETIRPLLAVEPTDSTLLQAGPMNGWSEVTESCVWLQTRSAATVQVRYWPEDDLEAARLTAPIDTRRENDLIASFVLTRLSPGKRHFYEVYVDGVKLHTRGPLSVQAQPLFLYRGPSRELRHAPPDFSFLLGSCAYVNDPPHDRPGPPYGGGYEIFETMAAENAAFMLWLGDNTYFREADWVTEEAMRSRYSHTRSLPELQGLLGSMHHYAIWDDHDFGPDNSDRSFRLKHTVGRVFRDYWPDVSYDPTTPACNRRIRWADAEFFLLDDRFYRSPNPSPDGEEKAMFGEKQRTWLQDSLLNSRATFKFVVNGNQMLNPVLFYEGLGHFPEEQKRLFSFLIENEIRGLIFLSGDRHKSEFLRLEQEGTYPWLEFTCSPLTSGAYTSDQEADNPARMPGSLIARRNYGRIAIEGPYLSRQVTFTVHSSAGEVLYRHSLSEKDLVVEETP